MSKHWFIAHLVEKFTKGKKLGLDVGIGSDNWAEFKKCRMVGIDKNSNKKIDIILDLEKPLPFRDNIFDIVIAINSLNYVENSRQLLNEINRVMKINGVLVCVVDNEKSTSQPYIWEQMYLNRILKVTGFRSVFFRYLKDYFYAKWYNKTSVYAFAVVQKNKFVNETFTKTCYKCRKPLGRHWKTDKQNKPYHLKCPENEPVKKLPRSHDIETTHPNF